MVKIAAQADLVLLLPAEAARSSLQCIWAPVFSAEALAPLTGQLWLLYAGRGARHQAEVR